MNERKPYYMFYLSVQDEDIESPIFQTLSVKDANFDGSVEEKLDKMYQQLKETYLDVKSDDSELVKFYKES